MPWLLASPGHQQPWYWLCMIIRSLSSYGKISTTCAMSTLRNDNKIKYISMVPKTNSAWQNIANEERVLRGFDFMSLTCWQHISLHTCVNFGCHSQYPWNIHNDIRGNLLFWLFQELATHPLLGQPQLPYFIQQDYWLRFNCLCAEFI